jgi:hypothetical protein
VTLKVKMERAALVKWKYFFGGRSPNLHVILSDPERKVEFCILCRYLARSFSQLAASFIVRWRIFSVFL